MANLYGRMQGNRGETTRMGSETIHSKLETWNGSILTTLHKDGTFVVYIGEKSNPNQHVLSGNVDKKEVY